MNDAIRMLRYNEIPALQTALERDPSMASKPQLVVEAARWGRLEVLKLLVRGGADLNAAWRGYRPLHSFIQEKPHADPQDPTRARLKCLDWLLSHGADPEQLGAWPLARAVLVAAFAGVPAYVERLLAAGARLDVFVACALGDLAHVKRDLNKNPDFAKCRDVSGLTSLQCCAGSRLGADDARLQQRLAQIAVLLLDAGADLTVKTKSWNHEVDAVNFAVSSGNVEILELLLGRGADATAALASAVWQQDDSLAKICLRHGAKPNHAKDAERPLLNEMVRWGRLRWVLWLLEKGADPNLPDHRGWTAVHQAASRGNARMFKALVDAGGDLHRRNLAGETPIEMANLPTRSVLSSAASPI
jgi:ankyrin repeat protein